MLLPRGQQKNDLITSPGLASIQQSNWYLLTKAQLIVEPLIMGVHGRSEGQRHNARHFLCAVDGRQLFLPSNILLMTVKVLRSPCLDVARWYYSL